MVYSTNDLAPWGALTTGFGDYFANETVSMLITAGSTIVNFLGIWFLTEAEPDAPEDGGNAVIRLGLRITAAITAGGGLSVAASTLLNNPALLLGGLAALAVIPQFFLELLYIRILAKRIPNDTLATQCMIVMVGLPAAIALVGTGFIWAIMGHGQAFGAMGLCVGGCSIFLFAVWYLVILVWFQKSLN